ncbi:hypothetical protein NLI96_g6247 [Meripilus lineatus]|uniref:Monooxygenase n=1 Tax=Meripilus lineatus TaxID=2056292 RepID=A0AAD5YD63_9APHY|nr:hypothetical protein NLI96_g6247 [Physisporinus lineatus]
MATTPTSKPQIQIVIVGAGVGGLAAGIALKRQLNFHSFKILEQAGDVGGTWNGCASDIDTHWYSLSTDLNPYWRKSHVSQPELKAYWKELAKKYSLYDQLVLNRQVTSVDWDHKRQLYKIVSQDTKSKEVFYDEAQVVISATGILYVPFHPPDLDGVKVFKGTTFHSARWDYSVDLHNKRVGVVGNGCSANQFLPIIARDPTTQVINLCRSPHWILEWEWDTFPEYLKWIFAHVPLTMRIYRYWIMARQEYFYTSLLAGEKKDNRGKVEKKLERYIKSKTPSEYHDKIIPKIPFGCRRFIVDSGYLSALHQDNFDVNYEGIAEFTESGIITKKGNKLDFDVIIFATGFVVDRYPLKVRGVEGITVQEFYDRKGGPEAYYGVTVPGFPNFYMLGGPNTTTGHASVIFTEEVQINYILNFVKPVIQRLASSFEVTPEANEEYNRDLQKKLSTSVWSSCTSWYRLDHSGKVISQWPGTMTGYWWKMRNPVWSHYKAVGANKWLKRQRIGSFIRSIGLLSLVFVLLWAQKNKGIVLSVFNYVVNQVRTRLSFFGDHHHTHDFLYQITQRSDLLPYIPWPLA